MLLTILLSAALAGCAANQTEAPPRYASKLDTATSGISTACGKAYRAAAFPQRHPPIRHRLERAAGSSARLLASVYHRDPHWIYLGESVRGIVRDSIALLDSCGLGKARRQLARAVTAPRSRGRGLLLRPGHGATAAGAGGHRAS